MFLRIALLASLLTLLTPCFVRAVEVHIAPSGNDTNPGTEAEPLATLHAARDAARKQKTENPTAAINVVVHGGAYRFTETLQLAEADSGTPAAPTVWEAATDGAVRLVGGASLAPADFTRIDDSAIRSRLPESARAHVLVLDLPAGGVEDLGKFPGKFRGFPAVPELFFNDQRQTLARWPNEGWTTVAEIIDSGAIPRNGERSGQPGTFAFEGDRPLSWSVDDGVWLLGYWCFDWYEEAIRVQSMDRTARRITLSQPSLYGIRRGNPSPRRFLAMNLLEELDRPGEYYIDRESQRLYFWPPGEMRGARIVLSTLAAPLVRIDNAHDLTFRGFTIEAGQGHGIEVRDGRRVGIERCEVRNVRGLGIRIEGGAAHRVAACKIHHTGSGGLVLQGGDRKTLTPARHEALDNRIWRFSEHQLCYASGITLAGVGNRAAHNLIHDAPHMAVSIRGNDHLFELNVVRDVCNASDDAGALYKGRNPSCRGNMIRYNLWCDVGSPMGHGTAAVYFDDGDGGDTVFGNIFVRSGHPGRGRFGTIFSHGGHDLVAENNIFVDCARPLGSAPWNDERWKQAVGGGRGCHWQKRLLEEVDITRPPYTTRYPELIGFMDAQPAAERVNRAKNNVIVRCDDISSGNWKFDEQHLLVTDSDPGFVDADNGNFALRTNAEVFKRLSEFQPIPFDRIGPRDDAIAPHE